MPIIAYQSFNSNASTNHGLSTASWQRFTRDANRHATQHGHQALVLPYETSDISMPIEGPANLQPIESLSAPQTIHVFGAQISLLWQNFYRAFGGMPDIMVCGELDTAHQDFASVVTGSDVSLNPLSAKRACQSFTAITQTLLKSQITFIHSDEGFAIYQVAGLIVVFVHVPNRIATSRTGTQDFYLKIAHGIGVTGNVIHLVIGDTNQSSFNFTKDVLNLAFGTDKYVNASAAASVTKIDNWNVTEKGTNSTGTKMYDVAVYRSDLVELKNSVAYLSQSSSGITITDHCGVGVQVELKKTGI